MLATVVNMIIKKMIKIITLVLSLNILTSQTSLVRARFQFMVKKFKITAINSGVSKNVVNDVMSTAKFLPKVIEYDRYQPEFYEDTCYIKKNIKKKS